MGMKTTLSAVILVACCLVVGCDGRDSRIERSLERIDYSGKTVEGRRVHAQLQPALENATPLSLQEPRLVDAAFTPANVLGLEACIVVNWICSEPTATGLKLSLPDGRDFHFAFDEGYIRENEREAEEIVIFHGVVWLSQEQVNELTAAAEPDAWIATLTNSQTSVGNQAEVVRSAYQAPPSTATTP